MFVYMPVRCLPTDEKNGHALNKKNDTCKNSKSEDKISIKNSGKEERKEEKEKKTKEKIRQLSKR